MSGYTIHALPVLSGILAIAPQPGAQGDYRGDLAHIHDWMPAMVISVVTEAELEAGAPGFQADVTNMGTRWVGFPISDFGVPAPVQMQGWEAISARARAALKGGGRVLIHCRAGCGRSGMVALRLMIEAGVPPASALERLRALRPCAVETEAQMEWATEPGAAQIAFRHRG